MEKIKRIALVAHDNRKKDLIEWAEWNYDILIHHQLISTGTTGKFVEEAIKKRLNYEDAQHFEIIKLKSGPLGGDQQLGAMIAEGNIDLMIFLWDPMQPLPHDVDVKALLRIAVLYNVPTACNRSTADFMISSSLLNEEYIPALNDYSGYIARIIQYES
ncbi:MAG: methylglyoxal synthase [Desulfobacterales bacterium]